MMKNKEKILNWYHSETEKDSVELEKTKNNIINSIKKVDKTKIFTKPEEVKLTLWQRSKKVLMGT